VGSKQKMAEPRRGERGYNTDSVGTIGILTRALTPVPDKSPTHSHPDREIVP